MKETFANIEELKTYIQKKEVGYLLIDYRNLEGYKGMVLGIGLGFDIRKGKYELNLEWISFGLDLYAENLMESYLYNFESLEKLLEYIALKYELRVSHIPLKYRTDNSKYPNPIKDKADKLLFENAWQQFQEDFKRGDFLDTSLELGYASHD